MKNFLMITMTLALMALGSLARAGEIDTNASYAKETDDFLTQGFGVHFGNVSGNGYAWRYMGEQHGFQLVLGGYTSGDNNTHFQSEVTSYGSSNPTSIIDTNKGRKYYVNFGANYIKPLKRTEFTLFYLHAGFNWNYTDQRMYNQEYVYEMTSGSTHYYYKNGSPDISHKVNSYINIGAGPGFELALGKYVKLALELPVTYTGKDEFLMYIPQAGLYYYFK